MALFEMHRPRGLSLSSLIGRVAQWRDERFAVKALSKMSVRELDDIGLTRGDVDRMARELRF
jgi:uncharacterized protein YjiS (DUF1127 family)